MSDDEDLNKAFDKAFKTASTATVKLPPDVMLKFYAYYKQATKGNQSYYHKPSGDVELRNAFKINAWLQLNHITEEEAKQEYIKLVNKYIK
jgi:acyl-CoA-binding protein